MVELIKVCNFSSTLWTIFFTLSLNPSEGRFCWKEIGVSSKLQIIFAKHKWNWKIGNAFALNIKWAGRLWGKSGRREGEGGGDWHKRISNFRNEVVVAVHFSIPLIFKEMVSNNSRVFGGWMPSIQCYAWCAFESHQRSRCCFMRLAKTFWPMDFIEKSQIKDLMRQINQLGTTSPL